ncbi:MAG: hypothetical protein ACK4NP_08440 [Parvularculaceae bacterium]
MLHLDLPSIPELRALASSRGEACVSIYLPTTPLTQHVGAARIAYGNLVRSALTQLEDAGVPKRRIAALVDHLDDLAEAEGFWRLQAISLAVLATPDWIRAFRLPNRLAEQVHIADRFHLKPLLRALTFPHEAFVLALSENAVRLVEVPAEGPAVTVGAPDLPKNAADETGRASVNDRSPSGRIHGAEGQKVLLRMYARAVDRAVRSVTINRQAPIILAAAEPLASIYRQAATHPRLAPYGIDGNPDRVSDHDLAAAARPILDRLNQEGVESFRALFVARASEGRATLDPAVAARAATHGMIDRIMVDMDYVLPGTIDEASGAIDIAEGDSARGYSITDEIACRALATGAEVMSVRAEDLPERAPLAAILRYPMA